jgi:membrane protein
MAAVIQHENFSHRENRGKRCCYYTDSATGISSAEEKLKNVWSFVRQALKRFNDDKCLQMSANLGYTTLLSLVPLITIALTLIAAYPVFDGFRSQLNDFFVRNLLPDSVGRTVGSYIEQFSQRAGKLTALGTVFLFITAIMTMLTIEHGFNSIWRVKRPRRVAQRVAIYWAVLTLGPILIGASISMTSYVVSVSLGLVAQTPAIGALTLWAVPFIFTILAFTLLYYLVPQRKVEPGHALIGGIVAGLLFELMKRGFAFYVAKAPTYAMVYGAFAAVPIFLLWIYLSWVVVLLGAEVTALLPEHGLPRRRSPLGAGSAFRDALSILRFLILARNGTQPASLAHLAVRSGVTHADAENVLETMSKAGWIARLSSDNWALICDPDKVRLSDVYRLFMLAPEVRENAKNEPGIGSALDTLDAGAATSLNSPLVTLASEQTASSG